MLSTFCIEHASGVVAFNIDHNRFHSLWICCFEIFDSYLSIGLDLPLYRTVSPSILWEIKTTYQQFGELFSFLVMRNQGNN